MNADGSHRNLTRQQLYERIWSTPTSKLAAEFGVSDVALAKHCKKLNVPRPPRGYWAKIEAGHKPPQVPLPPGPEQRARKNLNRGFPSRVRLKVTGRLHPLAAELFEALEAAKPDWDGLQRADAKTLPRVRVSKAQAKRAAEAFHAIVTRVEARGIPFRKSRSKYEPAYFEKQRDRLNLTIEEPVEMVQPEPTEREKRLGIAPWRQPVKKPTGRMVFTIRPGDHVRGRDKIWKEGQKATLPEIIAQMIEEICQYFVEQEKRRVAEAEEARRRHEEYLKEQEIARMQRHKETIENTIHTREEDLWKAAEWWRLHRSTEAFIDACEQAWRDAQEGTIDPSQEQWLAWARGESRKLSPFEAGYPDPARDGSFDPDAVPFGGPYPAKRDFPRPPTMPKIPPPAVQAGYGFTGRGYL